MIFVFLARVGRSDQDRLGVMRSTHTAVFKDCIQVLVDFTVPSNTTTEHNLSVFANLVPTP